jgi:hypothetical protein
MNNNQQNSQSGKPVYFNTNNFVEMVLKEIKMDQASPEVKEQLSLEIAQTLSDRVTSVVVASLGEKEVFLLEKTMEDHPELDEIDCLSIITSYIPGLDQKILKAVDDLFYELVDTVKQLDEKLKK